MKLNKIKLNKANPRIIKDDKFKKLVKSLREFPDMMDKRPIVVDADGTILGGNMRYKALCEIYGTADEIPASPLCLFLSHIFPASFHTFLPKTIDKTRFLRIFAEKLRL